MLIGTPIQKTSQTAVTTTLSGVLCEPDSPPAIRISETSTISQPGQLGVCGTGGTSSP